MSQILIILVGVVLVIWWASTDRSETDLASKVLKEQSRDDANPLQLLGTSTEGKTTTVFYKRGNETLKSVCQPLNEGGWICEHGPHSDRASMIK